MREPDNIREVEALEINWMGFIFYPRSPRYVSGKPAYLPKRVKRIGVFVDATSEEIGRTIEEFHLDGIQLHGHETPAECQAIRTVCAYVNPELLLIKALHLNKESDVRQANLYDNICNFILFDTPSSRFGGSGTTFDWNLLAAYCGQTPFILSGGIGIHSLTALSLFHHPKWAGIDLNSQFEDKPGSKNIALLNSFLETFKTLQR